MNFSLIFSKYDITSELMMLVMACMLLCTIVCTKPNVTRMYKVTFLGIHMCIVTILVHLNILYITCRPDTFTKVKFNIYYFIYVTCYITVINIIYAYICLLSYKNRQNIRKLIINVLILSVVYYALSLYPVYTDQLVLVYRDKGVFITN